MKRAQLAAICLALAILPAAALADSLRSTDSVGMQATVVEACTISLHDVGVAAAEANGTGGLLTFGCGERVDEWEGHGASMGEADARSYRVSYEREAHGSGGAVATIIF